MTKKLDDFGSVRNELCIVCRLKNDDHSKKDALRCKYKTELAHVQLMNDYIILRGYVQGIENKDTSEISKTELEDK
mgnify:FL=1|jgi:hypothetical protein